MGEKVDKATEKLAAEVADVTEAAADVTAAAEAEAKAGKKTKTKPATTGPAPYRGVRK